MEVLYVLQCEDDKWYIGKTCDFKARMEEHFSQEGASEWTRQHRPIRCIATYRVESDSDERNLTLRYMRQYGIENVRGGGYCQRILSDATIQSLENILNQSICYNCWLPGHYSNMCGNPRQIILPF